MRAIIPTALFWIAQSVSYLGIGLLAGIFLPYIAITLLTLGPPASFGTFIGNTFDTSTLIGGILFIVYLIPIIACSTVGLLAGISGALVGDRIGGTRSTIAMRTGLSLFRSLVAFLVVALFLYLLAQFLQPSH